MQPKSLPLRLSLFMVGFLILAGCAHLASGEKPAPSESEDACNVGLTPADNTRLAAIEQLVSSGKSYAAIAELDALNTSAPRAQLARADAFRRIAMPAEAEQLYKALISSCYKGRAHHGLGLLAARSGNLEESLPHLRLARNALPTDATVRNDLGYALLLAGQLEAAQFEFLTSLELSERNPFATKNLVLLTIKQGHPDKARKLAEKLGLDKPAFDRLLKTADELTPASSEAREAASDDSQQPRQPATPHGDQRDLH